MRWMAPRRSRTLLWSLLLVALLSIAATCGDPSEPPDPADAGPPAQNAVTAPLLPTHVAELPSFDVQTYQELLTQLHGTPVVVNVWAAWCGPCQAEVPLLHAASQTYGDQVQFLGVDILDSRDGARGFIDEHGLTYPSVFDPSGNIRDSFGVIGQPVTVFYDAQGNVAETWEGQLTQTALDQGIHAAMAA
jgi:cytochrome c biogenesis protein CcmG, thiol:disulfide interchange protein DsbE